MLLKVVIFLAGAVFGAGALAAAAYVRHRRRAEDEPADFDIEEVDGKEVFVVTRGGRTVRYGSLEEMPARDREMVEQAKATLEQLSEVLGDGVKVMRIVNVRAEQLAEYMREQAAKWRAEQRVRGKKATDLN